MKLNIKPFLQSLRKLYYTTTDEALQLASKKPGLFGSIFLAIYLPRINKNISKEDFLQQMLNRMLLIVSTMGVLFLLSTYLKLNFLAGFSLLACLSGLLPYAGYAVAKKSLKLENTN